MKYFLILLSMLCFSKAAESQTKTTKPVDERIKSDLILKAKGYNDKIVLRWGINNSIAWPFLQQAGVWIDRAVLDENNKLTDQQWIRVNKTPVKPWSAAEFQKPGVLNMSDKYMMMAAQALYGNMGVSVKSDTDLDSIRLASMVYNNNFTMAMLAADLSPSAATAMGFRYEDPIKVKPKYKYTYRVYPAASHPAFSVDTAYYIYAGYLKDEVYAPRSVQARGKDQAIEIYWPKKDLYNNYTSYNIERSIDGKSFRRLNKLPLAYSKSDTTTKDFVFSDSVANYKKWFYRVNGIDAFGDTSYYCPTVSATAMNQDAPPAGHLTAQTVANGSVILQWSQAEIKGRPLKGFVIRRGRNREVLDEAAHKEILPNGTTTFTDKPGKLEGGVYYQLISIDTAGNYAFSNIPFVFASDSIPPKAPLGLKGIVDRSGKVKVSWNLDYTDNVYAYRIFVSNNPTSTFSPVTADLVRDTTFTDSISFTLLNRKLYYKVVALDGNNNHSNFSEVLELIRPKKNPSPAPVISGFNVTKKAINFTFGFPPDDEIMGVQILRRLSGDTTWKPLAKLGKLATSYSDSTAVAGTNYEYGIQTIDVFQMSSLTSFPLSASARAVDHQSAVSALTAKQDDKKGIRLNWTLTGDKPVFYIVYKDGGKGLVQYKSADAATLFFVDNQTAVAGSKYGVQAVYPDQSKSGIAMVTVQP
ncbi:fibronectin type III domain-containing protein [Pedobacter mendelii]|nr:hypothetical protein [Pedobacter mendelii]